MNTTLKYSVLSGLVLASAALLTACGGDDFGAAESAQINLDSSGIVPLRILQDDRPQAQPEVQFTNLGSADLTFNRVEFVDGPDRLSGIQKSTGTPCTYDRNAPPTYGSECQTGEICWPLTATCRPLGFSQERITVGPDRGQGFEIVVLPGEGPLECPDPPADDLNAPANYCGKLVVETNATNSADFIERGTVSVYFTFEAGSGQIEVAPNQLSFDDAAPGGGPYTADFTISNPDPDDALTINGASVTKDSNYFDITGDESIVGAEIAPQATKTWSLVFSPPEGTDLDSLTGIYLDIESTAKNARTSSIFVSIGSGGETPVVTVEPALLNFESTNEQTITVTNNASEAGGETRPSIRLRSLDTAQSGDFYTFLVDGAEITGNINTDLIQPGEAKDILVRYARPDGATSPGATEARLRYSYFDGSDQVVQTERVTLLGDQSSAALGSVTPTSLLFRAASGATTTHPIAVRNLGNAPLDLTGAALADALVGSADDFSFDLPDSVAPGAVASGSVTYAASDDATDNVTLNLNSNTAGEPLSLNLFADANSPDSNLEAVITPSGGDTVAVNSRVTLNAQQSTVPNSSVLDNASWFLLARPDDSSVFAEGNGTSLTFIPDAPGSYTVALILYDGSTGSSTTYSFVAE